MKRMKAIAAKESLPIADERALVDVTLEEPELRPHDLLVAVRAVSVNPVDCKIRLSPREPEAPALGEGQAQQRGAVALSAPA